MNEIDSRYTSGLCPEDTAKERFGKPLVFQNELERSSCIPRRYEAERSEGTALLRGVLIRYTLSTLFSFLSKNYFLQGLNLRRHISGRRTRKDFLEITAPDFVSEKNDAEEIRNGKRMT